MSDQGDVVGNEDVVWDSSVCDNNDDDEMIEVDPDDFDSLHESEAEEDVVELEDDAYSTTESLDDDLLTSKSGKKIRDIKVKYSWQLTKTYSGESLHSEPDDHIL